MWGEGGRRSRRLGIFQTQRNPLTRVPGLTVLQGLRLARAGDYFIDSSACNQ